MAEPAGRPPRIPAAGGPFLVGVTGPAGSGKSLLCRLLAERHGVPVIDADALGREAIGTGGAARDDVVARFGRKVLGPDGEIDRTRLAALVFGDPAALARLEAASHPVILGEIERRVAALKDAGYAGIIVLDAAVLPGWLDHLCLDALVLVRAAETVRLNRLEARGMDPVAARRLVAAQEGIFAGDLGADRVLDNDGTKESLERAAEALWLDLAVLGRTPGRRTPGRRTPGRRESA
jgi:dephospho-CoA kinase